VAAVAVIAGLSFPTLLTLFVSPYWKSLGFERHFEMQPGQLYSAGCLLHGDLRDICFWRALTPTRQWGHRSMGPETASAF
jgi:hypothetical protein